MWFDYVDDDAVADLQRRAEPYIALSAVFLNPSVGQTHTMTASHIPLPQGNLYLGGAADAADAKRLKEFGITHVANCAAEIENALPDMFSAKHGTYKHIPCHDESKFVILEVLDEAADYIHNCVTKYKSANVLVHCAQGISRSATITAAYLIKYHKHTVSSALKLLMDTRPIVSPNSGFIEQLHVFEALVRYLDKKKSDVCLRCC